MTRGPLLLPFALLLALASCTPARPAREWAAVHEITPAALRTSDGADPSIAARADGRVALTWVTHDSLGANAWIATSTDSGSHFSTPLRLNQRPGSVSSYTESRPVVSLGPGGHVFVVWAARRDSSAYADDIVARASGDDGASYGPETVLNDDRALPRSTYHGFAALDVAPDGRAVVAWIDGRNAALAPGEAEPARSEIWSSSSEDGGVHWRANVRVAVDVCSCCRLALRADSLGHVALAYRGARDDLRDPRLAISHDGGTSFAFDTLVSPDHWKLPGCPSMGPSLTLNRGAGGHYAWFTGAQDAVTSPGVYVAPWRMNVGASGMRRALDDSLFDVMRPMLSPMGGATLAGVLGRSRADSTRRLLAVRAMDLDGAWTAWLFLGVHVKSAAIAGAGPRVACAAWVEKSGDGSRVRVARLTRR